MENKKVADMMEDREILTLNVFSLKGLATTAYCMILAGFIAIILNLALNEHITPLTISGQVFAALFASFLLILCVYLVYSLMDHFRG